jgi:hypothetical protein
LRPMRRPPVIRVAHKDGSGAHCTTKAKTANKPRGEIASSPFRDVMQAQFRRQSVRPTK